MRAGGDGTAAPQGRAEHQHRQLRDLFCRRTMGGTLSSSHSAGISSGPSAVFPLPPVLLGLCDSTFPDRTQAPVLGPPQPFRMQEPPTHISSSAKDTATAISIAMPAQPQPHPHGPTRLTFVLLLFPPPPFPPPALHFCTFN